jgi:hypothetical protein
MNVEIGCATLFFLNICLEFSILVLGSAAAKSYNYEVIFFFLGLYEYSIQYTCISGSSLKVPKREIFVTELIILIHPIWIGVLRTKAKKRFVKIVRLLFAILGFFR